MPDHRRLGRELGLFGTDPLLGAGLPYWLPEGAAVRHALEEYVRELEVRAGYRHVHSSVLGKRELYELSGHWAHYRGDMFPPMDVGANRSCCGRTCARTTRTAAAHRRTGRMIYRAERSGVLGGLSRVRAIQLNDAHIFCTPDQAVEEARAALDLIRQAYADLGFRAARYRLSLPGENGKYVGDPEMWARATALLADVLSGLPYESAEGEAAFYGPKIDVQVADSAGRAWTLSIVQIDFAQPARFDLHYVGADGGRHRPVMVHRSIIGSIERVVAQLIEVHGAFPAWLAPVQLVVLAVTDAQVPQAERFLRQCNGLRAELVGPERGSLGARVRAARLVPLQPVTGEREAAADEVSLRLRDGQRLDPLPSAEVLARLSAAVHP